MERERLIENPPGMLAVVKSSVTLQRCLEIPALNSLTEFASSDPGIGDRRGFGPSPILRKNRQSQYSAAHHFLTLGSVMMLDRLLAAVKFLILVTVSTPLLAESPQVAGPVGAWGDPARIQIDGAHELDSAVIKKGLAGNFQYFMASHPSAPLQGFADSVQQYLLRGYRRAGFREATIAVRLDDDTQRIVVSIDEGPRRYAGTIRVDGPAEVREQLAKLLGQRRAPDGARPTEFSDYGGVMTWADADGKKVEEEKPLWVPGQPAQFDAPAAKQRRERVAQSLADLGFDLAEFESTVTVAGSQADWHVRIDQLGPPAVLQAIETTGHGRNTREEIVDYLNLKPGSVVTRDMVRRIERSLWNSARFVSSKVESERVSDGTGVTLKIDVQEYPSAPSLAAAMSREERAMLNFRRWVVHGPGSKLDLVVRIKRGDQRMEIIVSPVDGFSGCWWPGADTEAAPEFALIATDDQLSAYSLASRRMLLAPVASVQLNASLTVTVNTDDPDHTFSSNFGFGFETLEHGETRAPLTLTTSMPPVFFLAQAHEQSDYAWQGHVLTVASPRGTLRIDERTGEMLEYVPEDVNGTSFGFGFERQALAGRKQQIVAATAGTPNEFDGQRPISSLSSFFLSTGIVSQLGGMCYGEEFAQDVPPEALAVLGKLADRGLLSIADSIVLGLVTKDDEDFTIPWVENPDRQFQPAHLYGFLAAQAADRVFPRDSWAWTLWRETSLVLAGLGQHAGTELNRLMADDRCGPSSYWMLAELLQMVDKPVGPIAQQGLRKFNEEAFVREWESALGTDLKPVIARTLASLRSLSDEDVAALTTLVDGPQPEWIRIASQFRDATQPHAGEVTTDLLHGIWSTDLRGRLEQRLRQLAAPARVAEREREVQR